jgi:hypothetical protein
MDEEFLMPDDQDHLFREFNEDYQHNATLRTGIDKFFLFSEGYKTAAEKLFEQLDGSAFYANMLVYPLIFLNRQFLELRLKELVSGLNFTISHEYKFPNGHGLKNLLDIYKDLIKQVGKEHAPNADALRNTEKLISEFNDVDPKSFSFRYPVDTTDARNPSLRMTNIDLRNFMTTMNKLYNFFDIQSDIVFHLIDLTEEFISVMRSEYASERHSY